MQRHRLTIGGNEMKMNEQDGNLFLTFKQKPWYFPTYMICFFFMMTSVGIL